MRRVELLPAGALPADALYRSRKSTKSGGRPFVSIANSTQWGVSGSTDVETFEERSQGWMCAVGTNPSA